MSVSGNASEEKRRNLLFINQPPDPLKGETRQGVRFLEKAAEYGIDDPAQCTHANFFDYDKDGDLDLFVIVNPTDYNLYNVNNIRKKKVNGESPSTDKLYRNNQIKNESNSLFRGSGGEHVIPFTDISQEAGILIEGYSLSLNISDLNNDGWSDIYITNDFLTNDILYINNQDGTFINRAAEMMKHTSFASMGVDVADINNDGLPEIYVLDMMPEDNYRQKMIMGSDNYDRFQYMLKTGYEPQYSRNTLQLNNGDGSFSEIGQLANVHKTDWSWSALLADYDNDGLKDLFVTNGFRRDLGDLDYINYTNTNPFGSPESRKKDQLKRIKEQPGAQLPNYIFKNENGLTFSKKSMEWGVAEPSYSHGAAYADLDKDGDLDLIVNNVSQEAFIYENQAEILFKNNYIDIEFSLENIDNQIIGTKIWIYYASQMQFAEYTPYHGYQSSVEHGLHFGLGKNEVIDSVKIGWTDGHFSVFKNVKANQILKVEKTNVRYRIPNSQNSKNMAALRYQTPETSPIPDYVHKEDLQVDFKSQLLLPHQHSKSGPPITVGDLNNDGLEDFYIGGVAGYSGHFFIQNADATFSKKALNQDVEKEDTDCLFFDFDNDGDLDLYVVSGGVVYGQNEDIYQDRVYINNGGDFMKNESLLPKMNSSGGGVVANDFDKDSDLDLFIGGRVLPNKYPTTPNSYLLENQGNKFKDITPKALSKIGMVTTALWTDIDNDNDQDLMLAGEFMPLTIFKNDAGNIHHSPLTINHSEGWWNTLAEGDFDQDGDMDYLAGNLGLNSNFKASVDEPVCVYAKDFDENGSIDPILCQYLNGVEYPVASRDKLIGQIPPIKNRFNNYKKYASAAFSEILKSPEREGMQVLEAVKFENSYIENLGNDEFKLYSLPLEMQLAPINKFLVEDINHDGHLDALAVGNSYATEVGIGRYDAFTGALLLGKGQGNFVIERGADCGFVADKDAKTLVKINLANKKALFIVGNNADSLQTFINVQNTNNQLLTNEKQ